MAFNPAPTSLWAGYTYADDKLSIPLAALDGLTAAEAHATTGDWRAIAQALLTTLYNHYHGLAAADKPAALVVSTPSVQAVSSGDFAGTVKATYSTSFYLTLDGAVVSDEPAA